MTNKERYILYSQSQPAVPIYMRGWWLDCNCGSENWNVLLYEKDGRIEAFMTYYQPWAGEIAMPIYSQSMGIWFDPAYKEEKKYKELQRRQDICDFFIAKLPPFRSFYQNFHYTFTDWLPFYWKGFKQTTRYNYLLPDISDIALLRENLGGKLKKNLSTAVNKFNLRMERGVPVDLFLQVLAKTYGRKGMNTPEQETLKEIAIAAIEREQGDILGAYDEQNRLHAVLFLVWQESCAYAIAGGRDPEMPNSNAHVFLKWEAIQLASTTSRSYDFQGSMLAGVEFINKEFGAIQTPYYTIYKGKRSLSDYFQAVRRKLKKRQR